MNIYKTAIPDPAPLKERVKVLRGLLKDSPNLLVQEVLEFDVVDALEDDFGELIDELRTREELDADEVLALALMLAMVKLGIATWKINTLAGHGLQT